MAQKERATEGHCRERRMAEMEQEEESRKMEISETISRMKDEMLTKAL